MAAALSLTLVALLWRTAWRWPLMIVGTLYTLLMGAARVYVGVHYPTDVLESAVFAVSGLVATTRARRRAPVGWPSRSGLSVNAQSEKFDIESISDVRVTVGHRFRHQG